MNIAIIAPPYPLEEAPSPPLGICYVAAACEKAGAKTRIFDYIISSYTPEKLRKQMEAFRPDIVGITSVTMNYKKAAAIITEAKKINPDVITMMGGPHVSFAYEDTLRDYPAIDLIIVGEGEQTLAELLPIIHDRNSWHAIKGLAFKDGDKIIFTGIREFIQDLDTLPIPARHLIPIARYQAMGFPVSIITSRGCPNLCIFCLGRKMVGHKVRYRSPALVVDEIEQLLSYGFTRINIADDLFTSNKKRVAAFCDEIKRRGIKFTWTAFSRVNTVDTEVLCMMKDAGCDTVSFGIESGNPEMLKVAKKGITLDQARQAVKACKESGVMAHASFIIGLPGESMETIADSNRFGEELGIDYGYHLLAPFPGTTLREKNQEYDLKILTDDWDKYDANIPIVSTSHLGPEDVKKFMDKYENDHKLLWQHIEQRYNEHVCSDYEFMRVEGYYRMHFIFKLLNGDLIENMGGFDSGTDAVAEMISRLTEITQTKKIIAERTIKSLLDSGLIKSKQNQGKTFFFWPHNRQIDVLPDEF